MWHHVTFREEQQSARLLDDQEIILDSSMILQVCMYVSYVQYINHYLNPYPLCGLWAVVYKLIK